MDQKIQLGYFGFRGAAQISRHLLAYTGANWENVSYASRNEWLTGDKKTLGFSFPNLPYLIEGDFKLTQSSAINHYIIRRSGKNELLGKDTKDQSRVQAIIGVLTDIRNWFVPLLMDPDVNKIKGVLQKAAPKFDELAKVYGEKDFALGYLTLADFSISEFTWYVQKIAPEFFASYPFLLKVRNAVQSLPEVKNYNQSQAGKKISFMPSPQFFKPASN